MTRHPEGRAVCVAASVGPRYVTPLGPPDSTPPVPYTLTAACPLYMRLRYIFTAPSCLWINGGVSVLGCRALVHTAPFGSPCTVAQSICHLRRVGSLFVDEWICCKLLAEPAVGRRLPAGQPALHRLFGEVLLLLKTVFFQCPTQPDVQPAALCRPAAGTHSPCVCGVGITDGPSCPLRMKYCTVMRCGAEHHGWKMSVWVDGEGRQHRPLAPRPTREAGDAPRSLIV